MTKATTPTEMSKGQNNNTNNATKNDTNRTATFIRDVLFLFKSIKIIKAYIMFFEVMESFGFILSDVH